MSRCAALAVVSSLVMMGCGVADEGFVEVEDAGAPAGPRRPPEWSADSHGKEAPPRYDLAFPQGKVARIDLKIAAADWEAMKADLAAMLGKFGGGGLATPEPGGVNFIPRKPLYVPAEVAFGGRTWRHVGVRFRGNYTLAQTWKAGKWKLSLRLDFDEFEERFPEIDDQRFWGVRAVALINGAGDDSLVREKVAGDLYRAAGVPAGRTAFYRVFVDHGQGPLYFGLYTAVEIPDDAFLRAHFGETGGNLYKPEGDGAKFSAGGFDPESFEKKTNERAADWSDVKAVFAALHAPRGNAAAWRAGLEKVFDVAGFLRWLAANELLVNWDTYGVVPHNYYLYGVRKQGGRLHWIPWDNTNAFDKGFLFWTTPPLGLRTVGAEWALIRFIADDPLYRGVYDDALARLARGPLAAAAVVARLRAEHALIAPYVVGPEGERAGYGLIDKPEDFRAELEEVVKIFTDRHAEAKRHLRID